MKKILFVWLCILAGWITMSFQPGFFRPLPPTFGKPIYKYKNNPISEAGFKLGRSLFYDPILSRDSTVSCASCHQSFLAFAHGDHALAHGIDSRIGKRNAPAIQNIIWKKELMWDGRLLNHEGFPINPIIHPLEMDFTMKGVLERLNRSPKYRSKFKQVFGKDQIDEYTFDRAMIQFTGMLISADSKYDSVKAGYTAFNEQEFRGYQLYINFCRNCHREPLIGGDGFANNGLPPDPELQDSGKYLNTYENYDVFVFAIPSLRNVEVTAPYMHDGRFRKLLDVMDHYNSVARVDRRLHTAGQLSEKDKRDLIAFLKTLTDRKFIYDPKFRYSPE